MTHGGRAFDAVLLDVDGTLVASNDAHAHAFVQAMTENGFHVAFENVRRLIGMGSDKLLHHAIGVDKNGDRGIAIAERKKIIFKDRYLPTLEPTPGARDIVADLAGRGLPLIAVSSAADDELDDLLKAAQVDDLLPMRTSADDADESKPAADSLIAALKKLNRTSESAVMIGDTPYDVQAGREAHVAVLALRCGGWADADLAGALGVYDDPADLLNRASEHF